MNWITVTWPMVASACLVLGLINLAIGLGRRPRAARLLLALSALTMAATSALELALMQVDSLAAVRPILQLAAVSVGLVIVGLTAFVWVYFGTGTKWLALAGPILYGIAAAAELSPGSGMIYETITGIRTVEAFGGASFHVIEGTPSPWNLFTYLGILGFLVFVVDASVRLWRRGGRRSALVIGGAISLFIVTAGVHSALVDTGLITSPYLMSWAYLAVLVAMAADLNVDVLAAAGLADRLRESERRMDLAGAAANLGMWTLDPVDGTMWTTARARDLIGVPATEHLDYPRFLEAVHGDDRQAVEDAVTRSLDAAGAQEIEYRVPLPDGHVRWLSARGQVEHDASGGPSLLRGVVMDVTAQHLAEEELEQLRSQLAHTGRVSMLGQLASALAHELSQPLGAILRNAEAAELFLNQDPPDLEELRAILADVRSDNQRAGGVIDRLRALLKRRSFAPRGLAVDDLLDTVTTLLRTDATSRRTLLTFYAEPGLPPVMGDPVHLQQVLLNLVLNAMDALDGPPAVTRTVRVSAEHGSEGKVLVSVRDSGPGILPEHLGQLFEPFFTTKENGMGIGLSISRTIIETHGGRIWAEDTPGGGATFRFTLPVAATADPARL